MKNLILIAALSIITLNAQSQTSKEDISQFDWILGNWKFHVQEENYHENWTRTEHILKCKAFSIKVMDTISKEFFETKKTDNKWMFNARTGNRKIKSFYLVTYKNNLLRFETLEDSYPKSINYTYIDSNNLIV
jgi:hypothetical protein